MSDRFVGRGSDLIVLGDDIEKASFGGDRSAAGRYAAQQRWKNHRKKDDAPKDPRRAALLERVAKVKQLVNDAEAKIASNGGLQNVSLYVPAYAPTEQVMDGLKKYDDVQGLAMVQVSLPVQTNTKGDLRTVEPRWSDEPRLNTSVVTIPSPELMELEQEVNAIGQEIIMFAEEELQRQGITQKAIDKQITDVTNRIYDNNARNQQIRDQFNPALSDRSKLTETERQIVGTYAAAEAKANRLSVDYSNAVNANADNKTLADLGSALYNAQNEAKAASKAWADAIDSNPILIECAAKEKELSAEKRAIKSMTERRYEVIHGLLREARTFGTVEPSMTHPTDPNKPDNPYYREVKEQVQGMVTKYIPSDIIKIVNRVFPKMSIQPTFSGGSFSRSQNAISTDPSRPYIHIHEYIHAVASSSSLARAMEFALLSRRTIGLASETPKKGVFNSAVLAEGRQRVRKSAQMKNGKMETDHIPDKFADPYQGRIYQHESTETLTVGHDLVFTDSRAREYGRKKQPKEGVVADIDGSATIIGLLFTLGATQ